MPTVQTGGVAYIGAVIAAGCGLWLGAHYKLGPAPAPDAAVAASDLAAWATPSADAAEPEFGSSPVLLVKSGGQWVTPEARVQAIADRQTEADLAAQAASQQAAIDQAVADATPPPIERTASEQQADTIAAAPERAAPAPAIPPPIVISALTP